MLFNKIRCHFCGSRSTHSRSSGISNFQCSSCEAINYLDSNGNIIDTPASVTSRAERSASSTATPFQTFTKPLPETLGHQENQAFCNTCLHNQRVYLEVFSNYLPDDDHPRYREYEDALPRFKEELAQKYPQVCKKCAPKAQTKINRADYYASTERIAQTLKETKVRGGASRAGGRDDGLKQGMRILLNTVGLVAHACVLLQLAWHIYGILTTITKPPNVERDLLDFSFELTPKDCLRDMMRLRFEPACYQLLSTYVPRTLLISTLLLWYNPGLKKWYHHTFRVEAVTGQSEYFRVQLIVLVVRCIAWYKLRNAAFTFTPTTSPLFAAHGFMVLFLVATQWVSSRLIGYTKYSANTKITPRPDELDLLGPSAGPADEYQPGQASSMPPSQLFARDRTAPFPIANLAPKPHTQTAMTTAYMPSPPHSQEDDEDTDVDGDAMDIDWQPSPKPQMPGAKVDRTFRPKDVQSRRQPNGLRSSYNHGSTQGAGWSGMRNEVFGMQDDLSIEQQRTHAEDQKKAKLRYEPPVDPSPFRGRLPQAPMSMERKLRNPVSQVQPFKMTPLSKQQDFLNQMRIGIEQGKTFGKEPNVTKQQASAFSLHDDEDADFSPAKNRTRGGLELRESGWKLASDVAQATGLEDLFGGSSFRIEDEPDISSVAPTARADNSKIVVLAITAALVALLAIGWSVTPLRRAVCLWLVARLEEVGV